MRTTRAESFSDRREKAVDEKASGEGDVSAAATGRAAAGPSASAQPAQKFFGILSLRERWGLSGRGRLLALLIGIVTCCLLFFGAYPFLAVTRRVDATVLVMEGWVPGYAARAAAAEFRSGPYQRLFTTGGPVAGTGGYVNDYNTAASVGADLLREAGISGESLQMVPSHVMGRDRTYSAAVALRDWFREHGSAPRSFNVVTEDAHARRTRLLFEKAFGHGVDVGVISVPNPDYDARYWWRYSEGVRQLVGELTSYVYARLFVFSF
jgi:uncharacterized SAM-binding protein YcdF (DUF218 family)